MKTAAAVVIVDRKTDIVPLVAAHADIAGLVGGQLAYHLDGPYAVNEAAGKIHTLAATHDTLFENITVFRLAAAGLVAQAGP